MLSLSPRIVPFARRGRYKPEKPPREVNPGKPSGSLFELSIKAGKLEDTGRTVDGLREQLPRRARTRRSCLLDLVPEVDWFFVID
jgi:hypothetical protein